MAARLEEINLLEVAPVRLASWEEVGDRVVVERPVPAGGGLRTLFRRFSFALSAKRLRLDEAGSFVWKRLDGRRTVGQIAAELRTSFGPAIEPAEERLGQLVRSLRGEGLVGYPGWDEGAEGGGPG